MKYALIPLRGAIDSNVTMGFLLLDLVNVNWGIQCVCVFVYLFVCVCVCVRACMRAQLIPNMIGLT